VCFAALACASSAAAYEARLAWSPVTGALGYRLYVRQDQQPYGAGLDVGAPTPDADGAIRSVLAVLSTDSVNYFTVTSYDALGSESTRSNELSLAYAAVTPFPTATPIATVTVTPVTGSDLTSVGGIIARVTAPTGSGNHSLEVIRDGDMPPVGTNDPLRQYDTFDGPNTAPDDWIGYGFTGSAVFRRLVFQEGMHFWDGGWFQSLRVEVRQGGQWTQVVGLLVSPAYPGSDNGVSFETYVLDFAPTSGDAIRLAGAPGGSAAFVSVGELRVFGDFVGAVQAPTPTATAKATMTAMPTVTATPTATPTATATLTPTPTRTATPKPTRTSSPTATRTATPVSTATATRTATPVTTATVTIIPTATATATLTVRATAPPTRATTPTSTASLTPTRTATPVSSATSTRTATPVTTETATTTPITTATGTPITTATAHPTEMPTATATAHPTETPVATATATDTPSSVPAPPTLSPVPAATPGSGSCGNNVTETGETCDGSDDAACPTLCSATCTCPGFGALPLDGWTRWQGAGTWAVADDPEARVPVLQTTASSVPTTDFGVAYPSDAALGLTYPILAATLAGDGDFVIEVLVEQDRGPACVLAYASAAPIPTIRKRRVQMALGSAAADGQMRTFYRDLAADLRAAFGTAFVRVAQVRVLGNVRAEHVLFAEASAGGRNAQAAASLVVPLHGWAAGGRDVVAGHSNDPAVDGPTLSGDTMLTAPAIYPAASKETLMAPFQAVSFLVRSESAFWIEIRLRTSDGRIRTVRYDERASVARASDRRAVLPLTTEPVPSSAFRLATLDLSQAVAAMHPYLSVRGMLAIRLRGAFEVADLVLQDPVD
jgi:hypothetical protein